MPNNDLGTASHSSAQNCGPHDNDYYYNNDDTSSIHCQHQELGGREPAVDHDSCAADHRSARSAGLPVGQVLLAGLPPVLSWKVVPEVGCRPLRCLVNSEEIFNHTCSLTAGGFFLTTQLFLSRYLSIFLSRALCLYLFCASLVLSLSLYCILQAGLSHQHLLFMVSYSPPPTPPPPLSSLLSSYHNYHYHCSSRPPRPRVRRNVTPAPLPPPTPPPPV